jgi:hypothetical protein
MTRGASSPHRQTAAHDTDTGTGTELRAPYELGEGLHRAIAKHLVGALKLDRPSAEMLGVARAFLRDQGSAGHAHTDRDRKRLQALLSLYVEALHTALVSGDAPAIVLAEVGLFLARSGAMQGLGTHAEVVKAVHQLTAADLPFPH